MVDATLDVGIWPITNNRILRSDGALILHLEAELIKRKARVISANTASTTRSHTSLIGEISGLMGSYTRLRC